MSIPYTIRIIMLQQLCSVYELMMTHQGSYCTCTAVPVELQLVYTCSILRVNTLYKPVGIPTTRAQVGAKAFLSPMD